jgi:hypothetical protein
MTGTFEGLWSELRDLIQPKPLWKVKLRQRLRVRRI